MESHGVTSEEWEHEVKVGIGRVCGYYRQRLSARKHLTHLEQDALIDLLNVLEDMTQQVEMTQLQVAQRGSVRA